MGKQWTSGGIKTMKTATVLIDSIKLDPETNFAINDFSRQKKRMEKFS